ncbi:flagellar hook-length control protein FliK [Marinobacter orientalis]|uniref:Flagellar hook-length control protein FliK n=1 Tax=Marinobacter orientalis TaxID=1928859 RepID=A0A7Y0WTD5_9GAMM|nr:flagellar hook-length control protein FliK [Marinobacter orientalis]NMT64721.1 flagellar hook-length control protein FliK [Marinobacter orientalis]TGX48245.1 flagellar hook-length control protein FliK [Marinobacter orientalis]
MSQMVLPQTSPQGPQSDKGVKPAPGGREKNGDSDFDTVSRSEQQRLDQKQTEKREQAHTDENARNEAARPEKSSDSRADDHKQATAATATGNNGDSAGAEEVIRQGNTDETLPEEGMPLTFAGLQALLMPASGIDGGTLPSAPGPNGGQAGANGVMPGMQAFAGIMPGLPGAAGSKPGQGAQGAGTGAGMALTEALMSGVAADTSRTQETPPVQGGIRFQAAAELASQQLTGPDTAKLPADVAALRGYTTSIDVPVNHAEWGDKLVGKLTWLTARNMSVAEIHLTPPDMGPMEVRVQVQQEQANITVHSANPAVRDQLELHSHRLRDMLNEQGLSLEQFDVSDSPQQQAGENGADENNGKGSGALADTGGQDQDLQPDSLDLTWKGEVDIFA